MTSSIPYNHAGEKYGLTDNDPVSERKAGFFIPYQEVAEAFYADPYIMP